MQKKPKMFLLFSHELTVEQVKDARNHWNVKEFIKLPIHLQSQWSQVPSTSKKLKDLAHPFIQWLQTESQPRDIILIQGDFGLTVFMVNWSLQNQRVPIYATTKRMSEEKKNGDGLIEKRSYFKHAGFRKYQI